jgi:hypothetical protein
VHIHKTHLQAALFSTVMLSNKLENPNSTWVSLRGTWITNILIVVVVKLAFSIIPGVTPEISWTLTNLTYNIVSTCSKSAYAYPSVCVCGVI